MDNWLPEDKFECNKELGVLVKAVNNDLALKILEEEGLLQKLLLLLLRE